MSTSAKWQNSKLQMSNRTVCSWALHWLQQRTPLHANTTLWMMPFAGVYIENWDGVGEEICIFTNSRDRRMVTLSGERITITTLHTFFRVACKSSQVYVFSEKERLISRKAAAVAHDAQHQAAPVTVAGPVRWELPVGWQCRKAAKQAANGGGL